MPLRSGKWFSIAILLVTEIAVMSLWFTSAAILPEMVREGDISSTRLALMSSGVQAGFVIGALAIAWTGVADRFDPRWVVSMCGVAGALARLEW